MEQLQTRKTVLVVDDDVAIRQMLTEVLEDEGYDVISAGNGQEALDELRNSPVRPSLILLDLMMPDMNGWQFRAEHRSDPHLKSIPVAVLSASVNVNQAAALGVADFLPKPVPFTKLMQTVERFCN